MHSCYYLLLDLCENFEAYSYVSHFIGNSDYDRLLHLCLCGAYVRVID